MAQVAEEDAQWEKLKLVAADAHRKRGPRGKDRARHIAGVNQALKAIDAAPEDATDVEIGVISDTAKKLLTNAGFQITDLLFDGRETTLISWDE